MNGHLKKLRENEETSRVGTKWTTEEEEKLINSIKDNKQLAEIAVEHKRTETGIRCRVLSIATRMLKTEGKTMDYVSTLLHLTPEETEILNKNPRPRVMRMLKNQEKPTENASTLSHITPEEIEELNKTLNPNDPMTQSLKLLEEIRKILARIEAKLLKE